VSCREQHVEAIPINTECSDFPWRNGALGASGVGQLTADGGGAFVPSQKEKEEFLQCSVTLLDDVVLDAEVFFALGDAGDRRTKSLNLTELLKSGGSMNLICVPRAPDDVPAGCRPPAN
jgi:hypothetical protein